MAGFDLPKLTAAQAMASGDKWIDVRKAPARAASGRAIRDADWIDPFALHPDHGLLTGAGRLIFFCVHGHEVSQYATALALMTGREAAYVEGGFEALVEAGAPTCAPICVPNNTLPGGDA